jgi:hypothetical protein
VKGNANKNIGSMYIVQYSERYSMYLHIVL